MPALRAPDDEAAPGESLFDDSEDTSSAVDPTEAPRVLAVPSPEALAAPPRARGAPREGAFVDADAPADESSALEPVEPAEPVVSAAANGTDTIAEPTPRATANAPTRPTYRAQPAVAEFTSANGVDGRPDSIVRTNALVDRRKRPPDWASLPEFGRESATKDDKTIPLRKAHESTPFSKLPPLRESSAPSPRWPTAGHRPSPGSTAGASGAEWTSSVQSTFATVGNSGTDLSIPIPDRLSAMHLAPEPWGPPPNRRYEPLLVVVLSAGGGQIPINHICHASRRRSVAGSAKILGMTIRNGHRCCSSEPGIRNAIPRRSRDGTAYWASRGTRPWSPTATAAMSAKSPG